jgi:hypothetical protein
MEKMNNIAMLREVHLVERVDGKGIWSRELEYAKVQRHKSARHVPDLVCN